MPKVKAHVVTTVAQYVSAVERFSRRAGRPLWFRGHTFASYRLLPSGLRNSIPVRDSRANPIRPSQIFRSDGYQVTGPSLENMFRAFKKQALARGIGKDLRNDFEWLFVMQHYGAPTRLLDWTTNALVGLYFALCEVEALRRPSLDADSDQELRSNPSEFSDEHSAVFVLDPAEFNLLCWDTTDVVDIATLHNQWRHYLDPCNNPGTFLPVAIVAPYVDERIRSQFGTFTLHGSNTWPLDYYEAVRTTLTKILIPHSSAPAMRRTLVCLGATKDFLMPDTRGLEDSSIVPAVVAAENARFSKSIARWTASITRSGRLL